MSNDVFSIPDNEFSMDYGSTDVEEQVEESNDEVLEDESIDEEEESEESIETEEEDESDTTEEATSDELDYKALYEKITSPFKANGKEVKVDNIEDAIQLMQMGANYSKKMSALKPNLKILRMLEKENLLNENDLSFLIDVRKKKPEAIAKLFKDGDIDPLNVDVDTADQYTQGNYSVSDEEINLDEVLAEVKATPTGSKLIAAIGTDWDSKSREYIARNPEILKVVNEHMGNGVYDKVMTRLEKDRLLGRLNGMTDLEAYKYVGDKLNAEGAFDNLSKSKGTVSGSASPAKQKTNDSTNKKKVALAKGSAPKKAPVASKEYDPLSMSDDEFEKMFNKL